MINLIGGEYMAQVTASFRMDEELKIEFEKVCNELGLNMTTAVVMFAKKVVREKRIPFEISMQQEKDCMTADCMKQLIKEIIQNEE